VIKKKEARLVISSLVFVLNPATHEKIPGIVVGNQKKISGIGYVVPILTYSGVRNILRENVFKK